MFGKIGSFLGTPLFADAATSDMSRISYARIYVEIEAIKEIPNVVPLVNESGAEFLQKVECEWKPPLCEHCRLFGHEVDRCRYGGKVQIIDEIRGGRVRKIWRPKVINEDVIRDNGGIVENGHQAPPQEEKDSIVNTISPQKLVLPAVTVEVANP
ncbi:hypothetical protein LIER_20110 [Lithospermum erythrorhizon]|uniref:DUF4283 domain-containing protein n=1 Tax=Lithospermum erythrorhizon TaxID=34254 RepID=A0AAV3QLT4_LITER